MTNPALEHNVLEELLVSGLRPEALVTSSPFYVTKTNIVKKLIKKSLIFIKYLKNRKKVESKFQPYFLAKKHNIRIYNSQNVNSKEFENQIKEMKIDYAFTFGFRILKENIIDAPLKGCINFHPAYLPNNRGATPSKWVIANNESKTGITFHYINNGIDKGDIIQQYEVPLSGYETSKILNNYLFGLGSVLLVQLIYKIKYNEPINRLNNAVETGSYEPPFKKENRRISETNTLSEIQKTVVASVDGFNSALYAFKGQDYHIINCVVISQTNSIKEFPLLTSDKNILMNTSDNKQLLLISKRV